MISGNEKKATRSFASLDGLRAISCLTVMIAHMRLALLSRFGLFGVRVFFVISGFLITSLLLEEYNARETLSLKRFYFRRTLRIFPAFYTYLAVLAIVSFYGAIAVDPRPPWLLEFTYTSNFAHVQPWVVGHTWSLSVEEQFYLLWPALFLWLGPRKAIPFLIGVLMALPLVRVVFYFTNHDTFRICHDFLAAGCLLALLWTELKKYSLWERLMTSPFTALIGPLAILLHGLFALSYRWRFAADVIAVQTVNALLLAVFLAWCVKNPGTLLGRLLNLRPMKAIGVLSYSLYLWHVMFIRPDSPWSPGMAVVLSFAAAALSYALIERPFLALRTRLQGWWAGRRSTPAAVTA